MKKIIFFAATLLLLTMASCQQDEDAPNKGSRAAVSSFFDSKLDDGESVLKDFFPASSYESETCYLINSNTELEQLYSGDKELPEIDFDKYTLLIGWVLEPCGYIVEKQTIDVADEAIVVTLTEKRDVDAGSGVIAAMYDYYFWKLCDKLPNKKVVIKKIKS